MEPGALSRPFQAAIWHVEVAEMADRIPMAPMVPTSTTTTIPCASVVPTSTTSNISSGGWGDFFFSDIWVWSRTVPVHSGKLTARWKIVPWIESMVVFPIGKNPEFFQQFAMLGRNYQRGWVFSWDTKLFSVGMSKVDPRRLLLTRSRCKATVYEPQGDWFVQYLAWLHGLHEEALFNVAGGESNVFLTASSKCLLLFAVLSADLQLQGWLQDQWEETKIHTSALHPASFHSLLDFGGQWFWQLIPLIRAVLRYYEQSALGIQLTCDFIPNLASS